MKFLLAICFIFLLISCNNQEEKKKENSTVSVTLGKIERPTGNVNCGYLDKKNNLWFGTNDDGVYKFDGLNFIHFTKQDGLPHHKISCIYQAKNGDLWFGTGNGISIFNGEVFSHLEIPKYETSTDWLNESYPVVNPSEVQSINQDKNGLFWIGTNGNGAYSYDGKTFTSYLTQIGNKMPDGLYHNIIQSITSDNNGDLWFASMSHGGVSKYDGGNFTHYGIKDGLSDDMIRTIYTDSKGVTWFGFNGNRKSGLTSYNGTFNTFSKKDGLCSPSILVIYEDKNGHLWLGSGRNSLCIFDGKSFVEFESKQGKINSRVLFIVGDHDQNIWFGNGGNQFWKYDGKELIDMKR